MSQKVLDLVAPGDSVVGVGPLIKLQSRLAQPVIPPNTTQGTDKGDTPYRLAILDILTDGGGQIAVYTVGRPNPHMAGVGPQAQYAQSIRCDGVEHQYLTKFDYAAFSLHNWIVELNGVPLTYDATPADLTEFAVNDVGGALQVEIGDGVTLPLGDITVIEATPLKKTVLALGVNAAVRKIINPHDYLYLEGEELLAVAPVISRAVVEFFYR